MRIHKMTNFRCFNEEYELTVFYHSNIILLIRLAKPSKDCDAKL